MKRDNNAILVVGSGGRCHAIVDALARSPRVGKIYCAPGNAGIAAQAECVGIGVTEIDALADFAKSKGVDLTVVGPEAALAAGIADRFESEGLAIFGPTKAATRIESSKEWAKTLMEKYGVPTGRYRAFDDFDESLAYVKAGSLPTVVKYDGLAAGKGVVVAESYEEAEAALRDMLLDESFGKGRVIVEEFLDGPEFSFMCVVSGRKVYPLALAQDHKRAYEGDKGPNTGGMGAYSPVPFVSEAVRERALREIMQRTADAMVEEGCPFRGVLYGGLILTADGPKVIEFNARFGDPETEVVFPRLESDFLTLLEAALAEKDYVTEWSRETCLGVVLAAKGYPGKYVRDIELTMGEEPDARVFHMGTRRDESGRLKSAGGRVLMVCAMADTLAEAQMKAVAEAEAIACGELFYRRDIGHRGLEH